MAEISVGKISPCYDDRCKKTQSHESPFLRKKDLENDSPSAYQSWLSTPRPEAIYSLTSAIEILL